MSVSKPSLRSFLLFCLVLLLAGCSAPKQDKPKLRANLFNQVHAGMTRDQVRKMLGKPFEPPLDPTHDFWRKGLDSSGWFFIVAYDAANRVTDYREVYSPNPTR